MFDPFPSAQTRAAALLAGELCMWCETHPKSETSHLCEACRIHDPDRALDRKRPVLTPSSSSPSAKNAEEGSSKSEDYSRGERDQGSHE